MNDFPFQSPVRSGGEDPNALLFVALGGANEIGMNLNLYGAAGQWLIVDCGVTFGDDSQPGLDVVMPDPAFIAERRDRLLGIVATHAHEDHIGAIPYLWPQLRCPVWATPFTASVLRAKLVEAGLADKVRINIVPMSGRFSIGPFDLELVTLTHSIPEPNAVVLRTAAGTVLHTGDWKLDPDPLIGLPADEDALRRLGDEGVLAMICDSTNALRPGSSGSEADLRRSLTDLVGRYDARVAVACFASNVARLETIAHAAKVHGREVALVGRSLWRIEKAARENGYLANLPRFLTEDEAAYIPRDRILMICTGSQGEPRSALARIARDDHPNVELETGDAVIFSSRIIPGNEKAIGRLQNALARLGVEIVTEQDHFVHVSGHPARDELIRMYQMIRPRVAIPVHGEARHLLANAEIAGECQVPETLVIENGDLVRLGSSGAVVIDEVPVGRLASDGKTLLPLDGTALKDRRRVVFNGSVVGTLVLDAKGRLAAPPAISLIGLVEPDMAEKAAPFFRAAVERALDELPPAARRDDDVVAEAARRTLRRALNERFGKRPLTEIQIVRIGAERGQSRKGP
ncbi:MAG TPA: ribonuclease J [Stellaceae bacterium]|jgi:ribonuclease J|nr:ribonuclease J [Stellaceae bacterium]